MSWIILHIKRYPCTLYLNRLIVLILIRKSITSLQKHLRRVTERLPLYHDDDSSSLAASATSPSLSGGKVPGDGDKPAADSMVGHAQNNVPPKPPSILLAPPPKASAPPPPLPEPPQPQSLAPAPLLPPPPMLPPSLVPP